MSYYFKKHWKLIGLVIILQILWAGLMVYQNVLMIDVFQGIVDLNFRRFLTYSLISVSLWGVVCVLECVRAWAKGYAIRVMNNHVRRDMVATMLQKSHQKFHDTQSGEYLSTLTNDVAQIEKLAWTEFFSIISISAQVIFSIVALGMMHWSLMASSLVIAAIMINIPKLFEKNIEKLGANMAQEQALATCKMKDLLSGMDVLRFFGKVDRFIKGHNQASDQFEKSKYKMTCTQAIIGEGVSAVELLCQLAVNLLVGVLSIKGVIIRSALVGCGNLCNTVSNGLAVIGQERLAFIAAKPYFEKITVHADSVKNLPKVGSAALQDEISVEKLSFSYKDKPILRDLSLRFKKGGKYAITGPSGCGKSTLLKLLLGWLPDYEGKICFDSRDAKDLTPEQIQQQMSYIEQNVFLFNTTIRENITLGDTFTDEQMKKALQNSALEYDLANMPLGLDTTVGEDGGNLSGGQKQRVAIARALIHNRSILLVDEGTSALDKKNADIVERSLLANPDLTLILVSHHLSSERKAQFDQVVEMEPVPVALQGV